MRRLPLIGNLCLFALAATPTFAQVGVGPRPEPPPAPIEPPRDRPFRGVMKLAVDATDTTHHVYDVHETIPVQGKRSMVLLYPQWEIGSHAATASAAALAGLKIRVGEQVLAWKRDPVDVFAFHVELPRGTTSIEIDFQFLSPVSRGVTMTQDLVNVPWTSVFVYPAGWFMRDIPVAATLSLPPGMHAATALDTLPNGESVAANKLQFATTTLERLADAPVYAARFFRREELGDAAGAPVHLDLLAEDPASLEASDAQLAGLRRLVEQTQRLFGVRHFAHYDFLVALGDSFPGPGGVEHLDSSENTLPADFLTHPDNQLVNADLLAHEFVHSWNGRYREPADLWTANLNQPMRDSLLWVYEGQTQFWGRVLAARAGQRTLQQSLDQFALDAAETQGRPGRAWKSLQDSSSDSLYMAGHPVAWRDWTRREDYYLEGPLLWLDIDARLREMTGNQRSLDDFARAFFGGRNGDTVTRTYTFADLCKALDRVAHADWSAILHHHLDSHDDQSVLEGLARSGWRLAWNDTPSQAYQQAEADTGGSDLSWSIGAIVTDKGSLRSVRWDGSAFRAGLVPGDKLVSVNGQPFTLEALKSAIQSSTSAPVELVAQTQAGRQTVRLDYRGPLRYPRLERINGTQDRLGELLAPVAHD